MIDVMILHMNDILMLMIVLDIIPNYNYYILFHYRGVCIHLYLLYLLMWCDVVFCYAVNVIKYWFT